MRSVSIFRRFLLLSAALPSAVFAQDATTPVPSVQAEDSESADIIVTGARLQALREIEAKRTIDVISDSISSDEIGTLPDFGLGEALTRVPGVSTIQNNARGEAQFLSIRGLNADYNLVQIDGVTLPANEIGRRNVSLDVIPSSLASRVEVYKSVTSAMNSNAIGGIANLRTRSAFDSKGDVFVGGRVDIGKWDYERIRGNAKPSGQAEAVVSSTFGPDRKFGFVLSGSYYRRDSASLNSASDNYLYFNPTNGARLNQTLVDVGDANVAPDRRRWLHYDNVRQRYGVFGKFEFDDHAFFKAAITLADFRHINDEERQSNIVVANGNPVAASITPTGGRQASANAQVDLVGFKQTRRMRYGDFAATFTPSDRIRGEFGVNIAEATYRQDAELATYRIANTANLGYAYSIAPGEFTYFDFSNPSFVSNPANYRQFEYGTNSDDNKETALTARANVAFNLDTNDVGFGVQAGAWVRFLDRRFDRQDNNFRNVAASTLLLSSVSAPESFEPYNGRGQSLLLIDPEAARAAFGANPAAFAPNAANGTNSLQSDYTLTEEVYASFLLARYRTDSLTVTAGLRYEKTDLGTASNRQRSGAFTFDQQGQSYDDWLPSAQINWDVTPRLRARAALSKTLGRPNYDDLAARESVSVNSSTGAISITSGNPGLRPRRSNNYDLSLEYYVSRDVLFSVGAFYKDISDEIVTVRNQDTEFFDGIEQLVTRTRPANAGDSKIKGVELNAVISRMRFLPGPFDGFGLSANVTLLDPTPPTIITTDGVTQRRLSGLFESANTVANVKLFYTTGPLQLQAAWNRLSPILFSVSSTDPLQDRRIDTSDIFDAQIRLKLNRSITIVAQGKNLTNERPRRMFGPDFELLREELNNGISYYLGALFKF